MGPDEESLSLADFIIAQHPRIIERIDRYSLAYAIMGWVEQEDAKDAQR